MAFQLRREEREIAAEKALVLDALRERRARGSAERAGLADLETALDGLAEAQAARWAEELALRLELAESLAPLLEDAEEAGWAVFCAGAPFAAERLLNVLDDFRAARESAQSAAKNNEKGLIALRLIKARLLTKSVG